MALINYGLRDLSSTELVKFQRILKSYVSSSRPTLKKLRDILQDEVDFRLDSFSRSFDLGPEPEE